MNPDNNAVPELTPDAEAVCCSAENEALVREILERVADRWTLLVIDAFEDERTMRFSRLQDRVSGISQKMLTKTLRQLERDGLVHRTVHPTVPPRVEYTITPLGLGLAEALCGVWKWAAANIDAVHAARREFDQKNRREAA